MKTIALTLQIEVAVLVIGLAVILTVHGLSGVINTKGLLSDKGKSAGFSPARLQLLLATIAFAFYYIGQVVTTANTGAFPPVPTEMLLVLGGSHTFYLGSKTVSLILETLGQTNNKRPKS